MTEQLTGAVRMDEPDQTTTGGVRAVLQVVRDQRKTLIVAVVMAVAAFWILGQLDRWLLAGCIAVGVFLGFANHVATEFWLFRIVSAGATPSRSQMVRATLVRLALLTAASLAAVIVFWPDGIGLLFGLAVFRLIALVMTTLPLLKELKSE